MTIIYFTVTGAQPHRNRKYFQFNNAHDCNLLVNALHVKKLSDSLLVLFKGDQFFSRISVKPEEHIRVADPWAQQSNLQAHLMLQDRV